MKQIVQCYRTGELRVEDVPTPICRPGGVLVRTAFSLISAGTERMKVDQARMGLLAKARTRPDKVAQVIESVKQVGVVETVRKVSERLNAMTPLGYSVAGRVEEVGAGLDEFRVGDLVACAGEGVACHAEFVYVPKNLCVRVPEGVDLKDAAFATVGAIATHGVRQAEVQFGDQVLVIGLGLVGLLTVQILKAAGCSVIGIDLDRRKVDRALVCGADLAFTRYDAALEHRLTQSTASHGVDAAIITASTRSSDPMKLAGAMLRDRGRVVVVGMAPIEADWQTYYRKELTVRMSRSYGPGRYDATYEQKGADYPIGYVKWTERRNLASFVGMLADGSVRPSLLGTEIASIDDAPRVYEQLRTSPDAQPIATLFRYELTAAPNRRVNVGERPTNHQRVDRVGIGLIGAGNFTTATLIPALRRIGAARRVAVCSAGGLSAKNAARRHGFEYCASDYQALLADEDIHAVLIATRHDSHARIAAEAVRAGKAVFVEKPLALTDAQLDELIAARNETGRIVMPGFNRRFSPLATAVGSHFTKRSGPIEVVCRVNAGALAADSWYQDADQSGWRIVSEGCHFVDLIQFICGCSAVRVTAEAVRPREDEYGHPADRRDNCSVILRMADGSVGTLVYVANGDTAVGKERIEVFGEGRSAIIDNWRTATLSERGRSRRIPAKNGKGHAEELAAFIEAVRAGESSPIPFEQSVACTRTTLAIARSMVSQAPEPCDANRDAELKCLDAQTAELGAGASREACGCMWTPGTSRCGAAASTEGRS